MKIKDITQTIILICCLVVIPVFALSLFLYSKAGLEYWDVLDKSFAAAFGFFGGAATLAAAYIASRLFNDWRHIALYEQKKENALKISELLSQSFYEFQQSHEILINIKKIEGYRVLVGRYRTISIDDLTDQFFKKTINIKTLCNLDKNIDQDLFKNYSNYQRHLFYFISNFKEVQKKYNDYYDALTRNMGNAEKRIVLGSTGFTSYEPDQNQFSQKVILSLFLSRDIGFYMKEDGGSSTTPIIYSDFNDMASKIYEIHKKLENEIIKALNPHE